MKLTGSPSGRGSSETCSSSGTTYSSSNATSSSSSTRAANAIQDASQAAPKHVSRAWTHQTRTHPTPTLRIPTLMTLAPPVDAKAMGRSGMDREDMIRSGLTPNNGRLESTGANGRKRRDADTGRKGCGRKNSRRHIACT